MAIVLTSAIAVPNIGRLVLRSVQIFDNSAKLDFDARNVASGRNQAFTVWARNAADGLCDVIRTNTTPVGFADDIRVLLSSLSVADAADQIEAAFRGGTNKADALRDVEQKCLDLGIVHSTLTGNVQ